MLWVLLMAVFISYPEFPMSAVRQSRPLILFLFKGNEGSVMGNLCVQHCRWISCVRALSQFCRHLLQLPSSCTSLGIIKLFFQQGFQKFCTHAAYVTESLSTKHTNRVLAQDPRMSNKVELMSYMCGIGNKRASRWSTASSAVQMCVLQSVVFDQIFQSCIIKTHNFNDLICFI